MGIVETQEKLDSVDVEILEILKGFSMWVLALVV